MHKWNFWASADPGSRIPKLEYRHLHPHTLPSGLLLVRSKNIFLPLFPFSFVYIMLTSFPFLLHPRGPWPLTSYCGHLACTQPRKTGVRWSVWSARTTTFETILEMCFGASDFTFKSSSAPCFFRGVPGLYLVVCPLCPPWPGCKHKLSWVPCFLDAPLGKWLPFRAL